MRVPSEKKDRSMDVELYLVKCKEVPFDGAMNAVNREPSTAKMDRVTSR